jgi:hypothetical protein
LVMWFTGQIHELNEFFSILTLYLILPLGNIYYVSLIGLSKLTAITTHGKLVICAGFIFSFTLNILWPNPGHKVQIQFQLPTKMSHLTFLLRSLSILNSHLPTHLPAMQLMLLIVFYLVNHTTLLRQEVH